MCQQFMETAAYQPVLARPPARSPATKLQQLSARSFWFGVAKDFASCQLELELECAQ